MQSDEIKLGMEVWYKARIYWHPAIVLAIYDMPQAIRVQCRSTHAELILKHSDVRTELEKGLEAKAPTKRRVKKDKQLPLFFGIVLLVLLSGCELPRAGQNYNPSTQYQWVPR